MRHERRSGIYTRVGSDACDIRNLVTCPLKWPRHAPFLAFFAIVYHKHVLADVAQLKSLLMAVGTTALLCTHSSWYSHLTHIRTCSASWLRGSPRINGVFDYMKDMFTNTSLDYSACDWSRQWCWIKGPVQVVRLRGPMPRNLCTMYLVLQ